MKNNSRFIEQIEEEYERISDKWLILHQRIAFFCAVTAFIIELVMILILTHVGAISVSMPVYICKYLFIPTCLNTILITIIYLITVHFPEYRILKKYTVSLCFSAVGFVLFTVHGVFPALYFLCILPIILTAVYGDYKLTTSTFICSAVGMFAGETIIYWDPDKVDIFSNSLTLINFGMSMLILAGFYAVCLIMIYFERQKNAASIKKELERLKLQQALLKDGMTGLFNRSALQEELDEMSFSLHTYTFVMIDLDNFKDLNDTFGHLKGDQCIKTFADILKKNCQPYPAFRFGGDEFCILFKDKSLVNIIEICEQIRCQLISYTSLNACTFLSASFGIAQSKPGMDIKKLLQNADMALYQSKNQKNCISTYTEETDEK